MKFILNKDKLIIEEAQKPNSGSVKYYEIPVEYDESWQDLTIKAVLVEKDAEKGRSVSLINNKVYIDNELDGTYKIGFVGYTIENEEKVYQISTNLKAINFNKGAGQIETEESTIPTPTEWEIYVAQIQEITSEINGLADDLEAQVQEVETKLENGDFDGQDGFSPVANVTQTETGAVISITDKEGTTTAYISNGADGNDGISPVARVIQTQTGATISITDKNGTTNVDINNGQDGDDGISPVANIQQNSTGATITIIDKNGTTTANINNGQNGYTPVRGTDYWTATDIATIEQYCADYIDDNITDVIGGSY